MYPGFEDNAPSQKPVQAPKKKQGISQAIQQSLISIKDNFAMKSVKPLLSAYEVYFDMTVKKSPVNPLPLKVVFFENYPEDKPRIYITRALGHKLINEVNGEIKYQDITQWHPKMFLSELLIKIQQNFNSSEIKEDPFTCYVQEYKRRLEQYARDVNNLSNVNIPQNPPERFMQSLKLPEPPVFKFDYLIAQKKHHSKIQNTVLDQIQIYNSLVDDYKNTAIEAEFIAQRYSKGKVLKMIQDKMMQLSEPDLQVDNLETRLADFHNKRKNYYRMEILKQKYLDN